MENLFIDKAFIMNDYDTIIKKVSETLVEAGSTFRKDQKEVYLKAIMNETIPAAKWVLEKILENAEIAEKNHTPLCDDTGIPHLLLEVGPNKNISGQLLVAIQDGIKEGLGLLPGRPMAIKGNDTERIDQSRGLDTDPSALAPAPIIIKTVDEDITRLTIMMLGGGPAIRAKTYRVFHKRTVENVKSEIVEWATEGANKLGCTPCAIAVGIGRSHFEASSMMIEAMAKGNFNIQNEMEEDITKRINSRQIGPLGLGGNTTVLGTFLKVGPQRASGVRIVCVRPCCCFEPRRAEIIF